MHNSICSQAPMWLSQGKLKAHVPTSKVAHKFACRLNCKLCTNTATHHTGSKCSDWCVLILYLKKSL